MALKEIQERINELLADGPFDELELDGINIGKITPEIKKELGIL